MASAASFERPSNMALGGKEILVIGGSGFIGSHVVSRLVRDGARVSIYDRSSAGILPQSVRKLTGSLSDTALLRSCLKDKNIVIHLAASSLPAQGANNLASEIRNHVEITIRAAELASAAGVGHFVFAGSGGTAYGYSSDAGLREDMGTFPINAYGISKLAIEHYLRLLDRTGPMRTSTLRISNPFGEGQRARNGQGIVAAAMEHAIKGQAMPIWGDGSVSRDFIHVEDVAAAFAAICAIEDPPKLVNIGSGEAISILTLIKKIETVLEIELPLVFHPGRKVDVKKNMLDIGLANQTLGWSPRLSLAEGLERTARWWLESADS